MRLGGIAGCITLLTIQPLLHSLKSDFKWSYFVLVIFRIKPADLTKDANMKNEKNTRREFDL